MPPTTRPGSLPARPQETLEAVLPSTARPAVLRWLWVVVTVLVVALAAIALVYTGS